ncbi:MAG: LPS export ABC transporter permease LptG [Candidatus Eisenbacteria sp.]|nr:LPS export ABC transporter permease LptG [Candidatus Eisenbacteria bacterium]
MRILDRYVLSEYLRNLLLSLAVFILLVLVVNLWEKIDTYIDHQTPALTVGRYYFYQIPYILSITLPMAMLLASLFSVGQIARHNELVAIKASGVSVRRMLLPLFLFAGLMSVATLLFNELVVPRANQEMTTIENYDIKKKPRRLGSIRRNVHLLGDGGRIYLIKTYDRDNREMNGVVIQRFTHNQLVERIDAAKAIWDRGSWVFYDGVVRTFSREGEAVSIFSELRRPDIAERPEDMAAEEKDPENMNFRELGIYIRRVQAGGSAVEKLRVQRHLKIAFPFASLIVVLLGASLSAIRRKSGLAFGFGISLALCFVYYGIMRVSEVLGQAAALPAPAAAWIANAAFAVAGILLLIRADQ